MVLISPVPLLPAVVPVLLLAPILVVVPASEEPAEEVADGVRLGPPLLGPGGGGGLVRALLGSVLARRGHLRLGRPAAMPVTGLRGYLPLAEDLGDHVGAPVRSQHASGGIE